MKPQRTILSNGLTVISQKNPDLRMFDIGIWGRYGTRHESPEQNGAAHFCEHMIFKGTKKYSELEINELIADVGGKSEAWTDMDMTVFTLEVLNQNREFAVELLADLILNSTFSSKNIDSEREVIFQEMYEDENDKEDYFNDVFSKLVYGEQSLSRDILGSEESLKNLNRKKLLEWYHKNFCGENLILSAAGDFEHEELVELAEKYFGKLARGQKNLTEPQKYIGGFEHIKPHDAEVKFELGFDLLAGDPSLKNEAKYLLRQILGGEEFSRLYSEIRVKQSLVYDISCDIFDENDVGFLGITATAKAQNIKKILKITCDEIKKLKTELVSERELERAKREIIVMMIKKSEDNEMCISVSAEQILNFGELQDLDGRIERLNSVTVEDIRQTAQAIFSTRLSYLVQGRVKAYYSYEQLCEMLK